ncbi:aromatic ring-hydroxylating oxygenase subunit alpha [Novosphingobium album (ex Hu et al. 2023)]|uniref:Aromatic ring-hydroxylating dioxygenase subunit alpha n=1 Tax=Novosphingobium album (ex Hu et al. 2023) TaxID=2930093 RepID=A0ABT0B393_9SPHN|nr:aromatic ring-hydroxylating dioxygenase subunit alpha [Novosphingobium album (ex Hu et al. 2023)]MCJ2179513.1 aromatic ring-hydroxylating dioxygenase subunit alpha [Novosphingobium album (ex Hu et al. 2023)]
MNVQTGKMQPGEARHPDVSTQDIIARDQHKAPEWVASESYEYLGSEDIDTKRYTSAEYMQEEFKRLWTRTWQFACREEHIPEVGDYYVYDIGPYSFIVTRVTPTEIRAYFNACLHRGTKLRASNTEGAASEFKCSFHGWSWNIDGSNKSMLCPWDFPHADPKEYSLPEARVQTLGGFVWINMDPDAPSLEDYLGPKALEHIKAWKLEDRYITCHVTKPIPSNWKLNIEAFMEAYHVPDTHPQVSPTNADVNSQYDTYGEHVNRFISTLGVVSPEHTGKYTEQDVLDMFTVGDSSIVKEKPQVPDGATARQMMADMFRGMFEQATNTDLSSVSDSEILDCFSYTIFPNTFLFPGISLPMVYRFRPNPKNHRESLYEVLFLRPKPKDGSYVETAEPVHLTAEQSFCDAESMDPGFGGILDQDTDNLFLQQEGVEASAKPGLTLGDYQEIRIRHFEQAIDKYMAMDPKIPNWKALQRK